VAATGTRNALAANEAPILKSPTTRTGNSAADPRTESAGDARRTRRRRRWAIVAVLFPLFFLMVILLGLAAMYYRHMEFFRPPAVGRQLIADPPLVERRDLRTTSLASVGAVGAPRARAGGLRT
jgi:hypothetical protein